MGVPRARACALVLAAAGAFGCAGDAPPAGEPDAAAATGPDVAAEPADAPVLDAPVLDAPVLDAPVLDAPVLDAPVLDARARDASVFDAARDAALARDVGTRDAPATDAPRDAPATTLPAGDLARVTAYFEANRGARYMEENCRATTYPGWSGVPLQLCRYRVSDRYSGGTRWADVILANASPAQLARWVVQAALERRGRVLRSDTDAIARNIIEQSGAQFPVAGVVYEDMDGAGQRIYPFRNGVTVGIQGLPYATREQPTETQMAAYRTNPIAFTGSYGRIASTHVSSWTALTGERIAADRSNWPDIVGREYRAAWGQDRNALIVAWARANL